MSRMLDRFLLVMARVISAGTTPFRAIDA